MNGRQVLKYTLDADGNRMDEGKLVPNTFKNPVSKGLGMRRALDFKNETWFEYIEIPIVFKPTHIIRMNKRTGKRVIEPVVRYFSSPEFKADLKATHSTKVKWIQYINSRRT